MPPLAGGKWIRKDVISRVLRYKSVIPELGSWRQETREFWSNLGHMILPVVEFLKAYSLLVILNPFYIGHYVCWSAKYQTAR